MKIVKNDDTPKLLRIMADAPIYREAGHTPILIAAAEEIECYRLLLSAVGDDPRIRVAALEMQRCPECGKPTSHMATCRNGSPC